MWPRVTERAGAGAAIFTGSVSGRTDGNMIRIRYVDAAAAERFVEVDSGVSLMEAAVRNGVIAIEGECGGACACATCHIYVPDVWRRLTGEPSEHETMMLEFGVDVDERSRLGCQIKITPEMDGMTVLTPRSQR
jgi:2Fe-2S ferredoxin